MSNQLKIAMNKVYTEREKFILIGLTGRTGSGCSTVANILKKDDFQHLSLTDPNASKFDSAEGRKHNIIYDFMKSDDRWNPFDVIEGSSIILSFVIEKDTSLLIDYLSKIQAEGQNKSFKILDFESVKKELTSTIYSMSANVNAHSLCNLNNWLYNDIPGIEKLLNNYYIYYTRTIVAYKDRIKRVLEKFQCSETTRSKLEGEKRTKTHLYTYLMQQFGNNIRCSGNPFNTVFNQNDYFTFTKRIENVIAIIQRYNECKDKNTRICIDAIRNPFEASYLRDKYRAFQLLSINTEDSDRKSRLSFLTQEELDCLDRIEYPQKIQQEELFFHQNIQSCLETADIHIYNPNDENSRHEILTKQLVKYIALMLHPGLITPTHIERCMQLAYNAKYNSGCLSRQVGAVVTDQDFSIKSVGWNDVPKGQVSCSLRCVNDYCKNHDSETYSDYEINNETFLKVMKDLEENIRSVNFTGRHFPYCFKDIYNGINDSKNQVYTRALHAEENAFLQISKYGGQGVQGGFLFTTASPCELCAKKAYQLGMNTIYYIDPYPGISQQHILKFGKNNNPKMILFYGAIGNAYISLYAPKLGYKDELEIATGINCKSTAANKGESTKKELQTKDIFYNKINIELKFNSRTDICCIRDIDFNVQCDELSSLNRSMTWTGSTYDCTELLEPTENFTLIDSKDKSSPYRYVIDFNSKKKIGENIKYKIKTSVKDDANSMQTYFGQIVKHHIKDLSISLIAPKGMIKNIRKIVYADIKMEEVFTVDNLNEFAQDESNEIYEFNIQNPNLFYSYCLEWDFC